MAEKTKKAAKAKKNSVETTVVARIPNAVKTLKGVIVDVSATHIKFKHPKPHSSTFNEIAVPLTAVVSYTGKKGKAGELVFIDNGDVSKRTGDATILSNGFIEVIWTDRDESTKVTTFNPTFASYVSAGLEAPDAATGWAAKKSKPKAAKGGEKKAAKKAA